MSHRKHKESNPVSAAFIRQICDLYGDYYDDRIEDSRPPSAGLKDGKADKREPGQDWQPGLQACHKSLSAFQRELKENHGIHLSSSKIRKILISGGRWTTKRSREIQGMYAELTRSGSDISPERTVNVISKRLGVSESTVVVNLPYINSVNGLELKSKNADRCAKYRARRKERTSS